MFGGMTRHCYSYWKLQELRKGENGAVVLSNQSTDCAQFTSAYVEIAGSTSLHSLFDQGLKSLGWINVKVSFQLPHHIFSCFITGSGLCLHVMSFTIVGLVNCNFK